MNNEAVQQADSRRYHQHHNIWFPVIIITTGTLLLLQNFGLISPFTWTELFKFWPILIIFAGLEMVFGHSTFGQILMAIITLVVLLIILSSLGIIAPDFLNIIIQQTRLV